MHPNTHHLLPRQLPMLVFVNLFNELHKSPYRDEPPSWTRKLVDERLRDASCCCANVDHVIGAYITQVNQDSEQHQEEGTASLPALAYPSLPSPAAITSSPLSIAAPSPSFFKFWTDQSTNVGIWLMPTTLPPGETRWCNTVARYPEPLPTSRTWAPGLRYGRRCSDAYACSIEKRKIVRGYLNPQRWRKTRTDHVGSTDHRPVPNWSGVWFFIPLIAWRKCKHNWHQETWKISI